jgi:S1/P1 Nuclease
MRTNSKRAFGKTSRAMIAFALIMAFASPALAWWDYGHRTVATIAWDVVKPETRMAIKALLKAERQVETPTCGLKSLEDASTWPDCIKGLGARFDYAFAWHYQNVDVCRPFDLKAACKDGNCVSKQIERAAKLLADPAVPPRERLMALAFLTHFVGDLHMPLHAGDRSDRGGNDVKAAYGIVAGRVNLHMLWDGPLAERAISTSPAGPDGLLSAVADNAGERWQRAAGSVEDWSRENWQVARDVAYATALGGDPCGPVPVRAKIDDAMIEKLIPTVRHQVLNGGLRLARLLDEALAARPIPSAMSTRPGSGARR